MMHRVNTETQRKWPDPTDDLAALRAENAQLRKALRNLLACCEKHPAFQKPSNTITADRVRAAREALSE
jgi:hypothetical protein